MKENFIEVNQIVDSLAKLKFLPVLKNRIKIQREFIDKCRNLLIQLQQASETNLSSHKTGFLENVLVVNKQIEKLITAYFEIDKATTLQQIFPDFYSALEKFISESDEKVVESQDPERFIKGAGDKFHIRIRKPVKKFFYRISNIPISASNLFRKLFRKSIKEKKVWKRIVLLKNLRQYHLNNNLSLKLIEISRKLLKIRSRAAKEIWRVYESLDQNINQKLNPLNDNKSLDHTNDLNVQQKISDLLVRLNQFEESLINEIDLSIETVITEYEADYVKAGTIENPGWKLRRGVLKKKDKQISDNTLRVFKGWGNNLTSLGDDWNMNNELYQIRYNTLIKLEKYKSAFRLRVQNNLLPRSEEVVSFVKKLVSDLNLAKSKDDLLKSYNILKNSIQKVLTNKLILETNNTLLDQNLSGLAAEFDSIVQEEINSVKKKRLLVKTDDYDKEIKDSEINTFSPREILEYSAAPKFFKSTGKLKNLINLQIQLIQNELNEIDHVSEFTIDSALNLLETENDIERSKTIAYDGLERVIKKILGIRSKLEDISVKFEDELSLATNVFTSDLNNLTTTENIFAIRLNLTKAKALQRSKQVRKQFTENVRTAIPQFLWLMKKGYGSLIKLYQNIRTILGFAPKTKAIASEISDYLAETESAIHKLPFVYQRLFEVKPLDDERFFFGRDEEVGKLNTVFSNWQKGKFAPTNIVCEKGGGATSLINFFLSNNTTKFEILRSTVITSISDSDSFFIMLSLLLKIPEFKSAELVIDYLNNLPSKKIIIIENLQRMYLRKVDGFQALQTFFQIQSKTNKNVFWLSTCTLYSWNYLNKTIHASDYFGYTVNLKRLNENQITNLVSKRHRVSGYNIEYEADENTLKSKTFKKLSEDEKQPYLMKRYFAELNKFAQSNISLALIFWLRSAREVVDDVIKIGSPPDLNYSFLESLSNDKVFALNALLLHDGLNEENHSNIFSVPLNKSNLLFLLLHDDGIIVKHNELFIINPLLYRQIVGLLKSKNIIH